MKHPYKKFVQFQFISMIAAISFAAIALIYGSLLIALFSAFALSLSFLFEGLIEWKKHNHVQFGHQLVRALIVLTIVSYLYFN
ncbi:hypothetical protein [Radiobacillus sp. PE A8.2]|uniref:hypothetical protein n=1 Tax=Radiobacillus sp. PE A8.2 TaxID=3380349 RepID=UPI00389027FF